MKNDLWAIILLIIYNVVAWIYLFYQIKKNKKNEQDSN